MSQETDVVTAKRERGPRSPSYPAIDLAEAIGKARQLYSHANRRPLPVDSAIAQWGYSSGSGTGLQRLAALKKFGLLEDEGNKDQRVVKLTPLALEIVLDDRPTSAEREQAIATAAKTPTIHAEILDRWPHGLPDDNHIKVWLLKDKNFNEASVPGFIAQLRATFAFAKLDHVSTMAGKGDGTGGADRQKPEPPRVGDWVQWVSQGVAQFPEGKRQVAAVHESGDWLWVEGSLTAMPTSEVEVKERATVGDSALPPSPPPPPPSVRAAAQSGRSRIRPQGGTKEDVFDLSRGAIVVQWPDSLTEDECRDVEDWLPILLRKIKRCVQAEREGSNG